MALQDQIIKRLQDRGVTVVDLRGVLPRRGTWLQRPVSAIKQIAGHWDAEPRPHGYDSQARYITQAWYHINKDWAPPGNVHGDGLMYAWKLDNVGTVFITRDLEDVLWSVGDQNYVTASYCFDGTTGNGATREQVQAEQHLLEVLCFNTPEIPAGQANALGHQEVPGNSTACPGDFLASIRSYRAERNTHPERYSYDYPPDQPQPPAQPTPVTPPAPAPDPVKVPEPPAVPAPAAPVIPEVPAVPVPGTIIQPEPGKGGGSVGSETPQTPPTGQNNAETIPVSTPPVATPAPNPTKLPDRPPISLAFPAPNVAHDAWYPYPEGERVVFLEAEAYAVDLTSAGPIKGPLAPGSSVKAIGEIVIGAKRYVVGKENYAIQIAATEPSAEVPPTPAANPVATASFIGAIIRFFGRLSRAVQSLFTRPL